VKLVTHCHGNLQYKDEDKILHQMTWIFKPPIFHLAKNLLPTLCIFVKVLQVIELAKWWLKSSIYIFWKVTIRLAIFILVGKLTFLHLKVFITLKSLLAHQCGELALLENLCSLWQFDMPMVWLTKQIAWLPSLLFFLCLFILDL